MSEYRAALESLWADLWEPKKGTVSAWLTAHRSAVEQCLSSVPQKQLAELLGITYATLSVWVTKSNVAHADGRGMRPIPGLVRPPAASEVKAPADVDEVGEPPGNNASPAGQDPALPAAPPPPPAVQPPPRSIERLEGYVEGMTTALRLIFGKEEAHGPA